MSDQGQGQGGRRTGRRAFRPSLDGTLESRLLLSRASVAIRAAAARSIRSQVAGGGQVAMIRDTDGELYNVNVIGGGTVRGEAMSRGRTRLIVDGTTSASILSINSVRREIQKGTAHTYPRAGRSRDNLLHIGEIRIASGKIGQILGYRTADLSGPIVVTNPASVGRIALFSIRPGGSITTAGDLDTLDIFSDANLSGGPGIRVGRDLNLINVGGNLNISDGSTLSTVRDIGLSPQPSKGTGPSGQGGLVQGNLNVNPGGSFVVGRALDGRFLINGRLTGVLRVEIPSGGENFVARGGFSI